jgi:hypothetical protein
MRFDKLPIGAIFFCGFSLTTSALFEKKSKSTAYTLHPVTKERTQLPQFARPIVGFGAYVRVEPLA